MNLKKSKIILSSHVVATGPSQNFIEFCVNNKVSKTMFIQHPLMYEENLKGSGWQLYAEGNLVREHYNANKKENELIKYFRDAFLDIRWVLQSKEKWDLYIGVDNLNAFCGIVLKILGKVKKVVYYTIDYVPERFSNKSLNKFYHWLDIFCVKHTDVTWNLSPRMVEGREREWKLNEKYRKKQILVPEGVWFDRIKKYSIDQIDAHSMVFLGYLVSRLGVQMAIKATPLIIKAIPDFRFIVIGKGEYSDELKKLAADLGVDKHVEFKGFIPDHKDVENMIAKCAIGIAPYADEEKSLSRYADPSKTKIYLGCGLPIIMTDIFYNAKEIEDAGAGKIVGYDADEIAKAVVEMMKNKDRLEKYKENATIYIKNLDWDMVFKDSLSGILP